LAAKDQSTRQKKEKKAIFQSERAMYVLQRNVTAALQARRSVGRRTTTSAISANNAITAT